MINNNTSNTKETKPMDMKTLVLKGLGKAKVKRIIRNYIIDEFNLHLEYNHEESFTFPLYCSIEGYGLPEMDRDDPFMVEELVAFVNNKI